MIPVMAFFTPTRTETDFWFQMLPIIFFFGLIYFLLMRPQIKKQREQEAFVKALTKGQKVITTGGIWGEVDAVDTKTVRLKVNDKTKMIVSRSAIAVLQPTPDSEGESK